MLDMTKKTYRRYADAHAPRSPWLADCVRAFWVGGSVCCLGELLRRGYLMLPGMSEVRAGTLTSVSLIALAALLTGLGVFDNVARYAGAGTLVPITGFANAITSAAIDSRAEGLVLGVGSKIFAVAGPVLLYGASAGALWGVVAYLLQRVG